MLQSRVTASPYEIGSSVSSVELLLDARTAAEGAAPLASQQLAAATRIETPLKVANVLPGPAHWDDSMRFVVEARSGVLGTLSLQPDTVVTLVDLIMGGRGLGEQREPSDLEVDLFTSRLLEPVGTLLDALAPGRPQPVAMVHRDLPLPARSLVVELTAEHKETSLRFLLEVLAHHLADDTAEVDSVTMERSCSEVPLEVSFKFAPVHLHAREVAALLPGDVICLDHQADEPIVGEVDGRPLVKGRVGVSRQRAAVEVVDLIERSDGHG